MMRMDLEQLNKSQIVLLTMLVSFVTSIATGIVTVSLVEKAPADVTRVVQRVVERTVEQVTPAQAQQATVVTTERTVIVREADLVAAAVAQNKTRIIPVKNTSTDTLAALGVILDPSGVIVTDASAFDPEGEYHVVGVEEEIIPLTFVTQPGGARGIALLEAQSELPFEAMVPSEISAQLGQTAVAFVGGDSIAQGLVSGLGEGGYIETSIDERAITSGTILINVDGEVLGISTGAAREHAPSAFVPIRAVVALLQAPEGDSETEDTQESATTTQTAE